MKQLYTYIFLFKVWCLIATGYMDISGRMFVHSTPQINHCELWEPIENLPPTTPWAKFVINLNWEMSMVVKLARTNNFESALRLDKWRLQPPVFYTVSVWISVCGKTLSSVKRVIRTVGKFVYCLADFTSILFTSPEKTFIP